VIVRTGKGLQENFHHLGPGDIVVGQMTSAQQMSVQLVDLLQRGIRCFPSALSQLLSRSKVAQAELLRSFMQPLTFAIRRRKDLLNAIHTYGQEGIGAVVSKQEHMHCGHGVRRWDHIEALYSCCGLDRETYPFVLQPFADDYDDVRVILIGDFEEAYVRSTSGGFRCNLSAGGVAHPYHLTPEQRDLCRRVMHRAQFPFAHIDLQVMPDGACYLMEISLNGGARGSRLKRPDVEALKSRHLEQLVSEAGSH
jgi:ribosomal protein S6--L-glutamate ligase